MELVEWCEVSWVVVVCVCQLCLAVADLIVQMPSWNNAVEHLIGRSAFYRLYIVKLFVHHPVGFGMFAAILTPSYLMIALFFCR